MGACFQGLLKIVVINLALIVWVFQRYETSLPSNEALLIESIESPPEITLAKPKSSFPNSTKIVAAPLQKTRPPASIPEPQIYDKTLNWEGTTVKRGDAPRFKLHLTQVGFNHPNQEFGLSLPRTLRTTELLEGVLQHPWFDPSNVLDDDDNMRHYFFFDRETCKEKNYPNYGKGGIRANFDASGGRTTLRPETLSYREALEQALSKLPTRNSYLVLFDCGGSGPKPDFLQKSFRSSSKLYSRVLLASLSAKSDQLILPMDQGLPPPAVAKVELNAVDEQALQDCNAAASRPYLASFMGNFRHKTRKRLRKLHNNVDVMLPELPATYRDAVKASSQREAYQHLLSHSRFGLIVRGDNLFTYRFAEVLSSGAIPVVLADDWVLPFSSNLWKDCLIRISEKDANRTIEILRTVSPEQECRMRKQAYRIYKKYLKTPSGTIAGLVEGMEASLTKSLEKSVGP